MELSNDQIKAFNLFKNGQNIFISGPGGTGKTELIKHIVKHANMELKEIQVCAMTGCAALLLNCGAKTIHSWSGIKRAIKEPKQICNDVMYNQYYKKMWKKTNILIIDEVSMMSRKIFELLNMIGKTIRKNDQPFGGIQIIFVGDFYQLPPVANDTTNIEESQFCFQSPIWFDVFSKKNHIILSHIFRQNDPIYKSILLEIREGNIQPENQEILKTRIIDDNENCVKIYPRKYSVEKRNSEMFSKIKGEIYEFNVKLEKGLSTYNDTGKTFDRATMFICKNASAIQEEIEINNLLNCAPIEQRLCLKKGTRVMCTVNKDMNQGICNGSQGTVIDFDETKIPIVEFDNGITMKMSPYCWQSEFCPRIAIFQIPLIWAWAITIHKIQGTTLESAEIDVGGQIFEFGQTYVALSRIKSLEGLFLKSFDSNKIKANPCVTEFYININNNHDIEEKIEKNPTEKKPIMINSSPSKITHFFTNIKKT